MGLNPFSRKPKAAGTPNQHLIKAGIGMMRPYKRKVIWAGVSVLGSLLTTLAGPSIVEYLINHGLVDHRSMMVVEVAGIVYALVAVASFFFTRWQTGALSGTGELILNDLRKRVFAHLLSQPMEFYDRESSGQLLSRMTADIDVLESLIQSGIGTLVMGVGLFLASIIVLIVISPLMFLATAICLIPVLVASAHYRTASTKAYRVVRTRIGETLSSLDEGLAGVRVVQAFRQERRVSKAFDDRNAIQYDAEVYTVKLASNFFPKVEGSGVVATAAILLIGGWFVHEHLTSVGAVAAYVLYVGNLFNSIQSLSQLFDLLQSSGAAFGTVVALLDTESTMNDPEQPVALPERGTLQIQDVDFAYAQRAPSLESAFIDSPETETEEAGAIAAAADSGLEGAALLAAASSSTAAAPPPPDHPAGTGPGRPVLTGVNLEVEQGEHLVLVGPTGAGKSTLAKLIGRLYDPTTGTIRFAGVDLRATSLKWLRDRIVVVPQEGFLFRGTVLDNILVGRPGAKEHEALDAVEALGLTERFDELPDGLHTDVGERGSHLSAGERQLVSLTRAALTDPAVLVMDEATSSIDPGTERYVEKAFNALTSGRTTITVAHRLTIAQRADRVALVDEGRVIEVGAHQDLVAAGGAYSRLFAAWQGAAAAAS